MLSITIKFELDDEQLKEIFENNEVKFSKKKVKKLQEEMELDIERVKFYLDDDFEELIYDFLDEMVISEVIKK